MRTENYDIVAAEIENLEKASGLVKRSFKNLSSLKGKARGDDKDILVDAVDDLEDLSDEIDNIISSLEEIEEDD